jgi:hypothetical protein
MPVTERRSPIEQRMRRYLAKLFGAVTDRIGDRVAYRLIREQRISSELTAEVENDEGYLDDLQAAEREIAEKGLPPAWEDVRGDLGLGDRPAHGAR